MPSKTTQFTDRNLAVFYSNLMNHYSELIKKGDSDVVAIYDELYKATYYSLQDVNGSLYSLDINEKQKVYQAFNAIFYALPVSKDIEYKQREQIESIRLNRINLVIMQSYTYPSNYYRYRYNLDIIDWIILNNLILSCSRPNYYNSSFPVHSHPNSGSSSDRTNDDTAKLLLVLLLLALAAAALVALFYMLHQFIESAERLWYKEGWLKAATMLATSAAFGSIAMILTLSLATSPLIAFALAAGFNPVGIVIAATIFSTLIGAGLACFVTSLIFDYANKKAHSDAMDPSDPERFRISETEEKSLIAKGIDPIKVKCAMIALRSEMAKQMESSDPVPSFLSRHLWNGTKVQDLLTQVRQVRRGEIDSVTVGEMKFDCKIPQQTSNLQSNSHLHSNNSTNSHNRNNKDEILINDDQASNHSNLDSNSIY